MKSLNLAREKVIAASGAMGLIGLGWWFLQRWIFARLIVRMLKTVTAEPRRGNPIYIAYRPNLRDKSGTNALSLGNPGADHLATVTIPRLTSPAIISIHAVNRAEMRVIVDKLKLVIAGSKMILAIEVNLSCPNVALVEESELLAILRIAAELDAPIIAKIGYQDKFRRAALKAAYMGIIQGITAINTVPWADVYPDGRPSPIKRWCGLEGSVSGAPIKGRGIETVSWLRTELDKIGKYDFPIIALGGIFTPKDAEDYLLAGATHIALGTALSLPIYWWQALLTISWVARNNQTPAER